MDSIAILGILMALAAIGFVLMAVYMFATSRQREEETTLARRMGAVDGQGDEQSSFIVERYSYDEEDASSGQRFMEGIRQQLLAADVNMEPMDFLMRCMVLVLAGVVVGAVVMYPIGILLGPVIGFLPWMLLKRKAKKRKNAIASQLPSALELMARSLQAGLGLNDSFKMVGEELPSPIGDEFARLFEEIRFGREYRDAFGSLLERNPGSFDLRIVVSSILLQRETGGNLIEILENISETVRQRFLFQGKVKAMTSEATMSAMILGSLPIMVASFLATFNPEYMLPLTTEPLGRMILGFDVCMYSIGIFLMRDLSRVEV
jgi:tight adherence protein B